nr:hypothetical protein [Tanacetum cinerariifolium]
MGSFIKWYCRQIGKLKLSKADLEGPAFNLVRPFNKNNISLQLHMKECHLLLTDQIDLSNPEGHRVVPGLRIDSYQTKLNITQPSYDASDFLFKEDYTIVYKLKAIIYKDRNNQKKMMRESEVNKFSDGTLTRILEKLDHMVKDFMLFNFNPDMENRIWSEDDKRRSKEFIEVIERRLKIRRIFQSLERFVSGRSSGNANVANAQRDGKENPKGNGCFECRASGHFKRDYSKLKNKNMGNRNAQG